MKIIIDIPEERLDSIKHFGIKQNEVSMLERALISNTPLDSVRADVINIADGRRSIKVISVLRILDRMGKRE